MITHFEAVGDGRFQLSSHPQWHHGTGATVPGNIWPLPSEAQAPVRALHYREEIALAGAAFDNSWAKHWVDPLSISRRTAEDSVPLGSRALPQPVSKYPLQALYNNCRALGLLEPDHGRETIECETSNKRQKTSGDEANAAFASDIKVVARTISKGRESVAAVKQDKVTEPLDKFKQQMKDLLELKNELREQVSVEELKEILAANNQDDTGPVDDLLERCADGMMFGALSRCQQCSGYYELQNGSYRCRGSFTGFRSCTFTTRTPGRLLIPGWSLGKANNNRYLMQWYRNQSMSMFLKDARLLEPESPVDPGNAPTLSKLFLKGDSPADSISTPIDSGELFLKGCMFVTIGKFSVKQAKLKESIQAAGGFLRGGATSIQAMSFLFWCGPFRTIVTTEKMLENEQLCEDIDFRRVMMKKSGRPLPMVKEQFLLDCLKKKQLLSIDDYILEPLRSTSFTELLNRPE